MCEGRVDIGMYAISLYMPVVMCSAMYREMAYIPMSTLPSHTGSYDMEGDTESQSIVLTKVVGFLLEAKNL